MIIGEIIGLAVSAVWSLADGLQDGGNSITEKMYAREISNNKSNSPALKSYKQEERRKNSKLWHRWGFVTFVLAALLVSYGFSGGSWQKMALGLVILATERVLIFNPAVAYKLGVKNWLFHLSDEPGSIDNFLRRTLGGMWTYLLVLLTLGASIFLWTLMQ